MKIEISVIENGQVIVSGNINETVVCLGLLEIAKDVIKTHAQLANKIIKPDFTLPRDITNKGVM